MSRIRIAVPIVLPSMLAGAFSQPFRGALRQVRPPSDATVVAQADPRSRRRTAGIVRPCASIRHEPSATGSVRSRRQGQDRGVKDMRRQGRSTMRSRTHRTCRPTCAPSSRSGSTRSRRRSRSARAPRRERPRSARRRARQDGRRDRQARWTSSARRWRSAGRTSARAWTRGARASARTWLKKFGSGRPTSTDDHDDDDDHDQLTSVPDVDDQDDLDDAVDEPRRSVAQAAAARRDREAAHRQRQAGRDREEGSSSRHPTTLKDAARQPGIERRRHREVRSTRSRSKRPRSARRASSRGTARGACSTTRSARRSRTRREERSSAIARAMRSLVRRRRGADRRVPRQEARRAGGRAGPGPRRGRCRRSQPDDRGPIEGSGMHLDDDVGSRTVQPPATGARQGQIQITLRSTPSGARPRSTACRSARRPRSGAAPRTAASTSSRSYSTGHAIARYRFVPITSGVIHARLEPVGEEVDAGVPAVEVTPPPPPPVHTAPPPPPTVIAPADAAPPPIDAAPAATDPFGPRQ